MSTEYPSSPIRNGIREEREVDIKFPDQISGPPVGWRSAARKVAMFSTVWTSKEASALF